MLNRLLLCLAGVALISAAHAADTGVRIAGDIPSSGTLTIKELETMQPQETIEADDSGSTHTYYGVPLEKALLKFGFGHGDAARGMPRGQKRGGWKKKVIAASAADGYQVFFSGAEITAELGCTETWLIWKVDGKALPPDEGPLRIIVPSDKDGSRWVYSLARVDIVDMRRIVPAIQPSPLGN